MASNGLRSALAYMTSPGLLLGAAAPPNALGASMAPSKLNAHSLALLNTFKRPTIGTEPVPVSPETKSLELPNDNIQRFNRKASGQNIPPGFVPSAEAGNSNVPRNAHQSALLGLFRNGQSMVAASEVPVAELSAGTPKTLGKIVSQTGVNEHQALGAKGPAVHLTSATVSGPLNAPDFGAVQKGACASELGGGHENAHTPVPVHAIASEWCWKLLGRSIHLHSTAPTAIYAHGFDGQGHAKDHDRIQSMRSCLRTTQWPGMHPTSKSRRSYPSLMQRLRRLPRPSMLFRPSEALF